MSEKCRKISRYARQEFHLLTESYDLMWKMSSRHFRRRNDNYKAAFIAYLGKAGPVKSRVNIKEIRITGIMQGYS